MVHVPPPPHVQPPWDADYELQPGRPFYILHYTYGLDFNQTTGEGMGGLPQGGAGNSGLSYYWVGLPAVVVYVREPPLLFSPLPAQARCCLIRWVTGTLTSETTTPRRCRAV